MIFNLMRNSRTVLKNAEPVKTSQSSLWTLSCKLWRYHPKQACKNSNSTNSFEHNEYLGRAGGNFARHFSDQQKLQIGSLKDETWVPVYRFRDIRIGSLIARLKLMQTIVATGVVPYFVYKYSLGEIPLEHCLAVSGLAVFAVAMLIVATRYFNRLIGVIAMTESNKFVRVGYLSFWGSRRNRIMQLDDIVPLCDTDTNLSDVVLKFRQYSRIDFLYLSRVKTEILDEERAELIFGDLSVFGRPVTKV